MVYLGGGMGCAGGGGVCVEWGRKRRGCAWLAQAIYEGCAGVVGEAFSGPVGVILTRVWMCE